MVPSQDDLLVVVDAVPVDEADIEFDLKLQSALDVVENAQWFGADSSIVVTDVVAIEQAQASQWMADPALLDDYSEIIDDSADPNIQVDFYNP